MGASNEIDHDDDDETGEGKTAACDVMLCSRFSCVFSSSGCTGVLATFVCLREFGGRRRAGGTAERRTHTWRMLTTVCAYCCAAATLRVSRSPT
jgi:hypothetical protein